VVFKVLRVCLSVLYSALYPCSDAKRAPGGNEGGVAPEQTYDRVESTQVRDVDTRAARCEYSRTLSAAYPILILIFHT
jgi:hypothetical protein